MKNNKPFPFFAKSVSGCALLLAMSAGLTACGGGSSSSNTTDTTTTTSAGIIGFTNPADESFAESAGAVSIALSRTGGSDGEVSVTCSVTAGTASSGTDYTASETVLTWADGDTADKTCGLNITDDTDVELDETLTVSLGNVQTATLDSSTSKTLTITDNDSTAVSGTVLAPNGAVAFNGKKLYQKMLAWLFGDVHAGISDVVSPVAGVTVEVYEIDASGNVVGGPITTATTDGNGIYKLAAPLDAPASKYIVRASGSTGVLDSRVTAASVTVDPSTDATSDLITAVSTDLTALTVDEISEMQDVVDDLVTDIDTTGLSAEALSTSLSSAASADEITSNIVSSMVAAGSICGTVTDSGNKPMAGIRVIVRDFRNWVTRNRTTTDSSGNYCLNVPVRGDSDPDTGGTFSGEYILTAVNRLDDTADAGRHASEWWSAGGVAYHAFDAEMITVNTSTPVTGKDFRLEAGGRISGTVTSDTGVPLEGVEVVIRDFNNRTRIAAARTSADGSYQINVIAGDYLMIARNRTVQPYGTEVYDGAAGTNSRNLGKPVNVSTAGATMVDFSLESGYLLSGTITDGATSNRVAGQRVLINVASGPSDRLRTNRQGQYREWLKPDTYKVYAYGQRNTALDMTASNQVLDFSASVSAITATLQDSANNPASQVKVRLYDPSDTYIGHEVTSSDGTVTLYTDLTGNHKVAIKVDTPKTFASSIYNGQTQLANGTAINIANVGDTAALGTITLPDSGVLETIVYAGNSGDRSSPIGAFSIDVRQGGTAGTNSFMRSRTRGNGSAILSLPAGTYDRVKMRDATNGNGNCNNVTVTAGQTTTLEYFDGDNTCSIL